MGFGPLVGLRDSLDPMVSSDPKYGRMIQNLRPVELTGPTTFEGRPGFVKFSQGAILPLGAAGLRQGQLVHHIGAEQNAASGGTAVETTLLAVGGQFYVRDWDTPSFSGSGVTFDLSARCYALTFTDVIVIHDGVNAPRAFDPAASYTSSALSNAPVFYGQPTQYYAKLFAISNTDRTVLVWSEENDATIGYETVPYSNSWDLGRSPLFAVRGTNEALYYFEERAIGAIRGSVTPEFTRDGTFEGVSQSVGTKSPDGVCIGPDEKLYFISADAEPHVLKGGRAVSLADDVRETIKTLDKSKLEKAITRYDPTTGLVRFGVVEIGQEECSLTILVNALTDTVVGIERGYAFSALGIVTPGNGTATATTPYTLEEHVPAVMHLTPDGYGYIHGTPNGELFDDVFASGTVAIQHVLESCHLATDTEYEKRFSRADMVLRAEGAISGIQTYRITPYGPSSILEGSVGDPREPEWDAFNWDDAPWAEDAGEAKLTLGLNALGRWVRHGIVHQEVGERIGFTRMTTEFTPAGDAAGAR